jgi:hypothetical protein
MREVFGTPLDPADTDPAAASYVQKVLLAHGRFCVVPVSNCSNQEPASGRIVPEQNAMR